ncbi:MAG TPA: NTP transferase domain-containing protein [Nocardioidaceae bacterium]|nr:NTP transferase domain-containing protein [Nocardioidaceae bacterium]
MDSVGGSAAIAAIVLTGGTGRRLGGVDKAGLTVSGCTLLERALDATRPAALTVVVGEPVPTSRPVRWTREDPPGGGPAAGLLAGLDAARKALPDLSVLLVLAVDMPSITAGTMERLLATLRSAPDRTALPDAPADGAVLADADGRRQTLAAAYRVASLQRVRPATPAAEHGLAVRRLLEPLRLVDVPARGDEARDVDTWADLRALDR